MSADLAQLVAQIADRIDDRTHVVFQRRGPDGKAWQAGVRFFREWPAFAASDLTVEMVGSPTYRRPQLI